MRGKDMKFFSRLLTHKTRNIAIGAALALSAIGVTACNGPSSAVQKAAQNATQQMGKKLDVGNDYPLAQMRAGLSDEKQNVRERTLRFDDLNKIGYIYLLTANGGILTYYTIKGKPSSMESELLNTQDITSCDGNNSNCAVVESVGGDGTYGSEEGGTASIFFFTTSGVMLETADPYWVYSDAPEHLTQPPLLTLPINSKPSSTASQLGNSYATPIPGSSTSGNGS